ncbi:NDP-sugar pyrophosphorylase family protein [Lachnospiraceae bacterium PF1-22]|uniref:nucleotidyltransferase family protein n=1 Tax=Ohessyouella blattaphilus TaxID=2949333 RepID=UPI003E1E2CC0
MKDITLVIMAAGIGSRFGGGIKQLEPVGPKGELIIDYSIDDAIKAGFNKVVFVIRKDLEKDFREVIGNRTERKVNTAYAFQEIDEIPSEYSELAKARKKPWGTGQAILCCKELVTGPFLVINADDFYGFEAYAKAFAYLSGDMRGSDGCSVAFKLKNTLSENGGVTRGVCVTKENILEDINETSGIRKGADGIIRDEDGNELGADTMVSMNMWGLKAGIMEELETRFSQFLANQEIGDTKEFLLPIVFDEMIKKEKFRIMVLQTNERWFGVTYREDKSFVQEEIRKMCGRS